MPILRAQSAMEYLATYGWAILIITVAFAALYAVGVFDINTYSTGALPGSCQVYRPYGPGTQQLITLQGVCTSGKPKFVAYFKAAAQQPIEVLNSVLFNTSTKQFTAMVWVNPSQYGTYGYVSRASSSGNPGSYLLQLAPGANNQEKPGIYLTNAGVWYYGNSAVPLNTWSFVVVSFNSGNVIFYIYNSTSTSGSISSTPTSVAAIQTSTCTIAIGTQGGCVAGDGEGSNLFIGAMANVQLYNTTVSANTIRQMDIEGLGGEPITIQNLIGWWPLNGDTNDYSGNGDSGAATGIIFESRQINTAGGSAITTITFTSTTSTIGSTTSTTTPTTSTSSTSTSTSVTVSTTSTSSTSTSVTISTTSTSSTSTSTTTTIAVSYITGSAESASTSNIVLSLPSGYNSYIFACGSGAPPISSTSFTATQTGFCTAGFCGSRVGIMSAVGYQPSSTGWCTSGSAWYMSIVGVGTNLAIGSATVFSVTNATGGGATTLSYTVGMPNSFVIIAGACGWEDCGIGSTPAGCTLKDTNGDSNQDFVFDMVCTQNAGSYSVALTTPSGPPAISAIAAYVFPTS